MQNRRQVRSGRFGAFPSFVCFAAALVGMVCTWGPTGCSGGGSKEVVPPPECEAPSIGTQPSDQTIPSGGTATLSVAAGGTGPLTYQWYEGVVPGGTAIPGATAESLTTGPLSQATSFWVRVTNECGSADSRTAVVSMKAPCVQPSIGIQPSDQTIPSGGAATLSVTAGGTGPLTYQWYEGVAPDGTAIPGATSATLTTRPLTDTTSLWARVTNECGSADSRTAVVSVNAPCVAPSIATQPLDQTVTNGDTATLSVSARGTAPLAYQWFRGAAPGGTAIPGATGASLTTGPLEQTKSFWVRVTNECGSTGSRTAVVTVKAPCVVPSIATQPLDQSVASGDSATLSVSAGGTSPLHYQWYQGVSGDKSRPVGRDSDTYRTGFLTESTVFWVRVFNECGRADTRTVSITVEFPQPEVRESKDGVLGTTLEAAIARNQIRDPATGEILEIETPTYEGRLIGPTLRLRPGDTLDIQLVNNFPPNPGQQRMGEFPHDPFTTNLHTHGLTVSPQGISDNVLREMEPGTTSPIEVKIPADHDCGTFQYHPHKHGSVSFQEFGGMVGFLIIQGCPGGIDDVPEIQVAKEILMGFESIRVGQNGQVPFVNPEATQFSSAGSPGSGLWSTYGDSKLFVATNGVTNPVLHMRPGEVQRWRLLNGTSGETLPVALQAHNLHIIAIDGLTLANMLTLSVGEPYVAGSGNKVDVLVQAGAPGTYLLQALDPSVPRSISPSGIAPAPRIARMGEDFPDPNFPVTLVTVVVEGDPVDMKLPQGPLPVSTRLPSVQAMLNTPPDAIRHVAFEICGQKGQMTRPDHRLPSCGWYFDKYNADYWGGIPFLNLLMMRDADDLGVPSNPFDPNMPLVGFLEDGLLTMDKALFDDTFVGNFEEWTVENRSNSDHPFHIHVNPFLLTHINGISLPVPEWRDTVIVPAATGGNGNINDAEFGSVTLRMWFDPRFTGTFVMHCHMLPHEDVGMMQRVDLKQR